MPNYNEQEMRMLANLLGKPALTQSQMVGGRGAPTESETAAIMGSMVAPSGVASRGIDTPAEREFLKQAGARGIDIPAEREFLTQALQNSNKLPIPLNENNMPMFATDTEYLNYLKEYDPDMFMQMQNKFYNTRGTMGEGKIEPINFVKGLLGL